ncbi:hypothetical protein NDA16_002363 [Ustilago loliicola]|nr:hypothetical protein NDA16_002363 [Ustilago loliicola]
MVSTSESTAAALAKDETVDSKINDSTSPATEPILDKDNTKAEADTSEQQNQEKQKASSSKALVDEVEKLKLKQDDTAIGETEASATQSTAAPAIDDKEAPEKSTSESTVDKNDSEETPGMQGNDEDVHLPTDSASSDKSELLTSSSAAEAPTGSQTEQLNKKTEPAYAPQQSSSDAETTFEAPSATDPPAEAPSATNEPLPAETKSESHADESIAPPTPPSKEGPTPPEKSQSSEATMSTATSLLPSTPQAQKSGRADRKALADPESVAAVAHALGRDSPALRSSMDTPKRIATPSELPKDTPQASQTPSDPEKQALKASDEAEGSGKAVESETAQASPSSPSAAAKSGADNDVDNEKSASRSGGGIQIGKGPPPTTQASEELPFDFNRFLEQMKHRSAQPVGEYVRSFIKGFAKKPYRTQDQIKLIFDFLDFIAARMRECDVWKNQSDGDFENAKEAMEKLVMNRLYPYTFTPAVQKEGRWAVQTDDLERDRVLRQRILLFGWLSEEHLDVPVGDHSRGFIEFSIQELLKINHYKAPRDKLICILNCCKVIFGMIRHLSTQENADTFIPVLIFVVLKANPENLISNVEYISRFRNPDRLSSESGYYLSSLMGAISFIETMDYTSLSNITQEEFEKRVEEAVSNLDEPEPSVAAAAAAGSSLAPPTTPPPRTSSSPFGGNPEHQRSVSAQSVSAPSGPGEEAAKVLPFTPMAATLADDTRAFFLRTGEAARTGLSRPMGALGRLINEGIEGIRTPSSSNNDSGMSTERQNSPAPASGPGSTGMTASTSRSKLFGGLFGSLDTSNDNAAQERARTAGYPGHQGQGQRRTGMLIDDEPQTPSTGDLLQDGFHPYPAGGAPHAPQRLLRPNMPQRGYSIDDTMFDDESAGRRNLMATSAHSGSGQRDAGYYDYDEESDNETRVPRNAAEAEQQRRRMQMQQDFGRHSTPSRRPNAADQQLQPGRRDEIAYENAQTEQAIQRSLVDQERRGAVEAAQNSASVETLKSIFPTMDEGVIGMVLQGCEGNVETAIDRLLEMQ